jgi:uncharacterized damage-inducible protein DinB
MPGEITNLLALLDRGYDHPSWHGPNLRAALSRLTPRQAMWRPGRGRHNIWEVAVHAAYWKYTVRRRLLGEQRGAFVFKGSNWFAAPSTAGEKEWRGVLALVAEEHRKLRAAVAAFPAARLHRRMENSKWTPAESIAGVAFHDVYHAGQIQLLKRLQRS